MSEAPPLRVVRGEPTEEELAALVVVLHGRAGPPADAEPEPPSGWARREDLLRRPVHPGPDAWRRAYRW